MARQLWLLRHADAEPHGTRPDPERRLTERGEIQARVAGEALRAMEARFEAVLVSPKVRAQQTARLAAERQDAEHAWTLQTEESLAGDYEASQALDAARALSSDGRLLIVGHEPDLSGLVGELTGARPQLRKGGLAVVRLEGAGGDLVVLMRPRELALIARERGSDV